MNLLNSGSISGMNTGLKQLQAYPFERLNKLLEGHDVDPQKTAINLAIGEPKHTTPKLILETLHSQLDQIAVYPTTRGITPLREAIAAWLIKRFSLPPHSLDPEQHILPVNGTREALFAIAQTLVSTHKKRPLVALPNPFYQIYEGAALLAGAEPYYLNGTTENNFFPDFSSVPSNIWQHCQLLYLCSPANPSGSVIDKKSLQQLLELAEQYDFVIVSDECYSEIYFDETKPPVGLLEYAHQLGNTEYKRCLVFHSLSKRSNVPGLRSGFVAGDSALIDCFLRYRTYHGCAMPLPTQEASIVAWNDETHVIENRKKYREKFEKVCKVLAPVLDVAPPPASFYLWAKLTGSDTDFAMRLYKSENIKVLPGSYLSRQSDGIDPGKNHIRIALVAELEECMIAATRIKQFIENNDDRNNR